MAAGDVTTIFEDIFGTKVVGVYTVEGASTYAAGGFALAAKDGVAGAGAKFGMKNVHIAIPIPVKEDANEAWIGRYDEATDKVQAYECLTADALQEVGAIDVSPGDFKFLVIGNREIAAGDPL